MNTAHVQTGGPKISECTSTFVIDKVFNYNFISIDRPAFTSHQDDEIFNTSERSNIILIRKFDYDPKEFGMPIILLPNMVAYLLISCNAHQSQPWVAAI